MQVVHAGPSIKDILQIWVVLAASCLLHHRTHDGFCCTTEQHRDLVGISNTMNVQMEIEISSYYDRRSSIEEKNLYNAPVNIPDF